MSALGLMFSVLVSGLHMRSFEEHETVMKMLPSQLFFILETGSLVQHITGIQAGMGQLIFS
jgi:hypothetical protein